MQRYSHDKYTTHDTYIVINGLALTKGCQLLILQLNKHNPQTYFVSFLSWCVHCIHIHGTIIHILTCHKQVYICMQTLTNSMNTLPASSVSVALSVIWGRKRVRWNAAISWILLKMMLSFPFRVLGRISERNLGRHFCEHIATLSY